MAQWGYARVSTVDQDPATQFDALQCAGIDEAHIITDHVSGTRAERPGLDRLLGEVGEGDVLTVWKLDRLGRSVSHLVALVHELGERGVQFRSLTEALDTTTPAGRLLFHMVAAVAQFERELTVERTKASLALAKRSNKTLGRPSRVSRHQYGLIHQMHRAGASQGVIASTVGLSRPVVGRVIRGEIASLDRFAALEPDPVELPLFEQSTGSP